LYAKKIAQGKGLIIPDDAKTNSATMSAWIDSNRDKTRRKRGRKTRRRSCWSGQNLMGAKAPEALPAEGHLWQVSEYPLTND
jgi:DNA topoisomerase-3